MNRFEKAAKFGEMMGKQAVLGTALGVAASKGLAPLAGGAAPALIGAGLGGGGTALYDLLVDNKNKKDRLKRALIGAGLGGLVGTATNVGTNLLRKA